VINRSWLFAPGHNEKLLRKALAAGSDAVILDLEDGVPMELKRHARGLVAEFLADHPAWVRVNAARSELCVADLEAVAGSAAGIRLPKVESAADVRWVAERAPELPLICAVESAQGVIAATEIASAAGVCNLALGGMDLTQDLNVAGKSELELLYARSHLVLASRVAKIDPPIDSVYPHLNDEEGLVRQADFARSLGFFGKSIIHPRQLAPVHKVFTPDEREVDWGRRVVEAFAGSGGEPLQMPDGQFVDLPVARRARRLLELADALTT
jgi:citrate lyase subunit beta / citryl-CoA lyase